MKFGRLGAMIGISVFSLSAQTWDSTGNGLLRGTYYFREIVYGVGNNAGDLSDAAAVYGNVTFSGTGTYTMTGNFAEYQAGAVQPFSVSGSYKISASGYGFLSSPISSGQLIYGLAANGIFIGSTTEGGFNDLFVAAPVGSPVQTAATLQGSYSVAYFNFPSVGASGGVTRAYDALLQFTANGAGAIGTVTVNGYLGGPASNPFTLSEAGVKYTASNGAEILTFPTSGNNAVSGQEYLYISPDGNFVFGGSPSGFDFMLGVRTGSAGAKFGGFYYQAGIDQDESTLSSGYGVMSSHYGSYSAISNGSIIGHKRIFAPLGSTGAYNYSYADSFPVGTDGNYRNSNTLTKYVSGAGGAIVVGLGEGPYLGISVAVQAPSFSGSGVYIYPNGVVNAASSAPFTSGIAPGELITIYGQNLAPDTASSAAPFPTTLNSVQVLINGNAVPVYVVSPTQISAQVPFGISTTIAQIQVVNNGTYSNAITEFVYPTDPGVFTVPPGGLGYGAVLHADYSLVTSAKPAQIGETVLVYVTGLGVVFPAVADGAPAPLTATSNTVGTITADVGGVAANVVFAGLAPGFAGLYQINLQIPAGLTAGDKTLDIAGPDSYSAEAVIPIGAPASSAQVGEAGPKRLRRLR